MTTLTETDALALLDQLHADYQSSLRQPGEITTQEYGARYNLSPNLAYKELEALVSSGKMEKRRGRVDGRKCGLYKIKLP